MNWARAYASNPVIDAVKGQVWTNDCNLLFSKDNRLYLLAHVNAATEAGTCGWIFSYLLHAQ
jgi:hypothetical protein